MLVPDKLRPVTFLFTDIEGSTRLWEQHPEAMLDALDRHDELIEEAVDSCDGFVVRPRGEGDSRFAVFPVAVDAVRAALKTQRALEGERWPGAIEALRVRIALHTGLAEQRRGDFYGSAVNRCARLRALGHGGQTLVSGATEECVRESLPDETRLLDLGTYELKDLSPERVFQLLHPRLQADFPPLRVLDLVS